MMRWVVLVLEGVSSDLPVHCLRSQVAGEWRFEVYNGSSQPDRCGFWPPGDISVAEANRPDPKRLAAYEKAYWLHKDGSVGDSQGLPGRWRMVYDEAFEIDIGQNSYFAFFEFWQQSNGSYVTNCAATLVGWWRNISDASFGCFYAKQLSSDIGASPFTVNDSLPVALARRELPPLSEVADAINRRKAGWQAAVPPGYGGKTLVELMKRVTKGRKAARALERTPSDAVIAFARMSFELPVNFSWVDHMPAVSDQGDCGNCYTVSAVHALDARLSISSGARMILSPEWVTNNNYYGQACNGGTAYALFRFLSENPPLNMNILRYYYVGSGNKASQSEEMRWEIFKHGPIVASLAPGAEFALYKSGVYRPADEADTQSFDGQVEWLRVEHSVVIYGWGEESGVLFWLGQNSWGGDWGESGRFRIIRGVNALGIESLPEAAQVERSLESEA